MKLAQLSPSMFCVHFLVLPLNRTGSAAPKGLDGRLSSNRMRKVNGDLLEEIVYGNMRGVKRALAAGAAVDGPPGNIIKPIIVAATQRHPGVISLLLSKGANLDIAAPRDPLPAEEGWVYPRGTRAIHAAANAGQVDVLRVLLQAGAQPNVIDGRGRTPLIAACSMCPSETAQPLLTVVEVLLEAGALPRLADDDGRVPLHGAARLGADDAIEVLVTAAPGTLTHADKDGVSPLCLAAMEGHESAVRVLLSAGASDKEAWGNDKEMSLGMAANMGHEGVAAVLLGMGSEAVGGVEGVRGAMLLAIRYGHPRVLDMLLGVDGEEMRAWWTKVATPEDSTCSCSRL